MIPQRISIRGFLSYRDEQEVCFDGSSLWMLSGLNGSGKSAIFDALTYALFGHHRGGHQNAQELINKDSPRALIDFDFTQDDQLYRAHRTLQRTSRGGSTGTQQILRWKGGQGGHNGGRWVAVEGTSRKADFDAWISQHIGLPYEPFTSSVLLLQGKAEKLLDSTAKGRFEVLAGIVDLERYRRLHEKADSQRKKLKNELEVLRTQLDHMPEISPLELASSEQRIAEAEAARQRARTECDRRQQLQFQARHWAEIQTRQDLLRQRWQQARSLMADSQAITRNRDRLKELRSVLPQLEMAFRQHCQAQEAERNLVSLKREVEELEARLADRTQVLEQARQKKAQVQKNLVADEQRLQRVGDELRQLEGILARAKEYQRQQQALALREQELAGLPENPPALLDRAQAEHDRNAAVAQALPLLERLFSEREKLCQTQAAEQNLAHEEQELRQKGERLAAENKELTQRNQEAAEARKQADLALAAAQALLRQVEDNWEAFTQVQGAKVCRLCGQPLTAAHLEAEQDRRQKELAVVRTRCARAADDQGAARSREAELQQQLQGLKDKLDKAREDYRDLKNRTGQTRRDGERHRQECHDAWSSLPETFRNRVSPQPPTDWPATAFPSTAEMDEARQKARGLAAARQRLGEAQAVHGQWTTLQAQVNTIRQTVAALAADLPADLQAVHQRYAINEADRVTLARQVQAWRSQDQEAEAERERLQQECESLRLGRSRRDAELKATETAQQYALKGVAGIKKVLPEWWQGQIDSMGLANLHAWQQEQETLQSLGTDQRAEDLEHACHDLAGMERQLVEVEAEGAAVPEEARQPLGEIEGLLRQAMEQYEATDGIFQRAQQEHLLLATRQQQRANLERQAKETDGELKQVALLTQLLGRDRLQLYLVRQAERQVVDFANAVLDRLSAGQMFLRLRGGDTGPQADEALELEAYNRASGQQPIQVAFLSGSQRFRVAVSLALGIGQYASRQHRPIESVIIDEGFGCLDRQGRQVMVQELQNLRGQLRCILLVSHQEDFAEAFSHGYHFEMEEGTTKVTRVQR